MRHARCALLPSLSLIAAIAVVLIGCTSSKLLGLETAFAKRRFLAYAKAALSARYSFFLFRMVRFLIFSRSETTWYFRPT